MHACKSVGGGRLTDVCRTHFESPSLQSLWSSVRHRDESFWCGDSSLASRSSPAASGCSAKQRALAVATASITCCCSHGSRDKKKKLSVPGCQQLRLPFIPLGRLWRAFARTNAQHHLRQGGSLVGGWSAIPRHGPLKGTTFGNAALLEAGTSRAQERQ